MGVRENLRWKCEFCGVRFAREKSGARPIRFCTQKCYHAWNRENGSGGGRFKAGMTPWNKGVKGTHFSPDTEFKPGRVAENRVPVGTVTIRRHHNEKNERAWIKVAEPNDWKMRSVHVWEELNGPVPAGCVIHHRDRNSLNDAPNNLQCMTRAEHIEEHRNDLKPVKDAPLFSKMAAE